MAVTNVLVPRPKPCLSARQAFMYVVAVFMVSVVAGLVVVGHTPVARAGKLYERRVEVGDPIAGRLYPYQVVGVDTYELCRLLSTQFRRF